jgi:GTP-binding protein
VAGFFDGEDMKKNIRNIAVIAHVDHGKTTLVDALLKQTHVFRDNQEEMGQTQIMDSNELERERGITILAKNCSVTYKDTKINIIDTPGHADFSGEVERTLGMADGALLIVDAAEGPMPQTRFVLKKALELGLKIIVVINKIDKKLARPDVALNKVESLFLELASNQKELDFEVLYAVGRKGIVFDKLPESPEAEGDVKPLLEAIIYKVPAPVENDASFKMSISSLDYDSHLGRIAIGKIYQGVIKKGMKVVLTDEPGRIRTIEKITVFEGLKRTEVDGAGAGEIIAFSGIDTVKIGSTVADPSDITPLSQVVISEPTIHITIGPNTSPFAGREGIFTTSRQIEERLVKELESNLSLRVEKLGNGKFAVSGRGELHLSILLETLRREGFELEVGKPEVILKKVEGATLEPVEEVSVIVPKQFIGVISEEFGKRHAKLIKMDAINAEETEFIYHAPTRVLIGLRSYLLTQTKGTLTLNSVIEGYEKIGKIIPKIRKGALIASQAGESLAYGLENAQGRGITFIDPGTKVYEGMIVGVNAKDEDIAVNVCKGKKLTNMRSKSSDGVIQLTPATILSLEQSLDFLEKDELLEITPKNIRLRKKHLTELERRSVSRNTNERFLTV